MWLKKYWPALVGLALQAGSLWKFLKWALDWRGRYDALAGTYHEVGGMGTVIGYILDPPPWFYPVAFVAGVILIWWNFRRNREQANAEISPPRGRVAPGVTIEAPLPDKPEVTAKQERVFVPPELTPERLFSFYQDSTAIHAAERFKAHIGQWMNVTGTLGNVSPWTGHFSLVTFENSSTPVFERTWLDYTTIYMYFRDEQKIDRLKILKRGDKITVIGQIKEVDAVVLHLDNCELAY
jgi:hypothetical protein